LSPAPQPPPGRHRNRSKVVAPIYEICDRLTDDLSFVAASLPMMQVRRQILQIAPVDVPVFISGESGVGKEVVARMIHLHSARARRPFIKVNCAALPAELLESELFGYEQGAFTGANRAKPGRFESANQGTIFLDEIGEMSPPLQAKLLQVLQDNQYVRLGGQHLTDVDVRVVAASNINIAEAIRSGRLRKDLYYRLNVLALNVPPLRERKAEIPVFFRYFLAKYSRQFEREPQLPSQELLDASMRYLWPGNLRELENFVKRYVILDDAGAALRELQDITARHDQNSSGSARGLKDRLRNLKEEVESQAISDALESTHWCRKRAAAMLGISYKALLYKIHQFNLDATPDNGGDSVAVAAGKHA
jgi:two-component system response regulator AtoC